MKTRITRSPNVLLSAALFAVIALLAPHTGTAQVNEYNQIIRDMEEDYQNASQTKGRDARKQAYVDHGKRFAARLDAFLKANPTSKVSFDARLNLAQLLQMAKERQRARDVIDEAVGIASGYAQIKRAAGVAKLVHLSARAGWDVIAKNLDKVESEPLRAKLHFELMRYIDVPKELKGKKRKDERNAYKRKKAVEICEAVAKGYPNTEEGRLSALVIAGSKMKVGQPAVNLKALSDIDGRSIDFDQYKGKVIILHFWTAGSRRTYKKRREYLKKFVKMGRDLKDKVAIIGVNVDYSEDRDRVDNMIGDTRMGWQTYLDGEKLYNKAALIYNVRKFPTSVLIDQKGNIYSLDEPVNDTRSVIEDIIEQG